MDDHLFVSRGSKPYGKAWYRLHLPMPQQEEGRRHYLHFEGVLSNSTLWVNSLQVKREQSGTSAFWVEVTDFLFYGGDNVISIQVDADFAEGWYYEGGGLYRPVHLVSVEESHFAPEGLWVQCTDVGVKGDRATLKVEVDLENPQEYDKVELRIFDPLGQRVAVETQVVHQGSIGLWLISLSNTLPWSLTSPHLYRAEVELTRKGHTLDQCSTDFGIRHMAFDADRGFFLNGQSLKLQGVCCHQDHAGVGVALDGDILRFRLEKLKELGANAYRSAHHPASRQLLELCDELGILVLEEQRLFSSAPQQLDEFRRMIKRERSHPCIFAWSIGNEPGYLQMTDRAVRMARRFKAIAKEMDPTRPITLATHMVDHSQVTKPKQPKDHAPNLDALIRLSEEVDLFGMNYNPLRWPEFHAAKPQQPFFCTEASSSLRTRGAWPTDPPACTVYGENEEDDHFRIHAPDQWRATTKPWVAGSFIWTGFDYRGEPTPYRHWPAIASQFGLYDSCGFLKDNGRYFMCQWKDEPQLFLSPHWNLPVREGTPVEVHAFSNVEHVVLFLNDKKVAEGKVEKGHVLHLGKVRYHKGRLSAKGFRKQKVVVETEVVSSSEPRALKIWQMNPSTEIKKGNTLICGVEVIDGEGRFVPDACLPLNFEIQGAILLGTGNGNPTCHEKEQEPKRTCFHGLAQVMVRVRVADDLRVSVHSEGLNSATIAKEERSLPSQPVEALPLL